MRPSLRSADRRADPLSKSRTATLAHWCNDPAWRSYLPSSSAITSRRSGRFERIFLILPRYRVGIVLGDLSSEVAVTNTIGRLETGRGGADEYARDRSTEVT